MKIEFPIIGLKTKAQKLYEFFEFQHRLFPKVRNYPKTDLENPKIGQKFSTSFQIKIVPNSNPTS